jgi:hypothetical protein
MEQFIIEVETYAADCGLKPTTVVQRAAGVSGSAWARWVKGGSCTLATADKVRAFMAKNPRDPQTFEEKNSATGAALSPANPFGAQMGAGSVDLSMWDGRNKSAFSAPQTAPENQEDAA